MNKYGKMLVSILLGMLILVWVGVAYGADITLTWTAVADDGSDPASGPAEYYDLRWADYPITSANFEDVVDSIITSAPKNAGELESASITLPDGHYYFAIKVYDEAGNVSEVSNVVERDFFPPSQITDLQ